MKRKLTALLEYAKALAAQDDACQHQQEEVERLRRELAETRQQLSAALAQLHRYAPCKTCIHRDRSAPDRCGCKIGGCSVDKPDLWKWDGG